MGLPQNSSPPHLYPQALQLKLYQAFIFSVPILFSIILLLLFYLFYLKRRRDSTISSSPTSLARRMNQPTPLPHMPFGHGMKEEIIQENLPVVSFDEDLRLKESQCCVCLGDFELSEQLHQIPSCKHLFHIDCIHHWLKANYTCPLCRCCIYSTKKIIAGPPPLRIEISQPTEGDSRDQNSQLSSSEQQLPGVAHRTSMNVSTTRNTSQNEESTSTRTCLRENSNQHCPHQELILRNSVIIEVEMHPS